jgi:nucleotide-binding universal stress UspA family protein
MGFSSLQSSIRLIRENTALGIIVLESTEEIAMKVIIALDESECSEMALQSVLKRQWPEKTEFKVLSVFEPMAVQCVGWHAAYMPLTMIEADRELLNLRKKYIAEKTATLRKKFGDTQVAEAVIEGSVWRSIVEYANNWKADLIIVGSHGRSGFSKLFIGSVAEAVAGHADCSVEIIKGHQPITADVA